MSKQVTVYYALQSPWTYFGWARLRELVAQSGATATTARFRSRPCSRRAAP